LLGPFTGQGAESISLAEKREQVLQKLQKFLGRVFLFTRGGVCVRQELYMFKPVERVNAALHLEIFNKIVCTYPSYVA
jgi:hypothetical protein